ncbi:formiminotransferase-cyclodeaminase [Microlunatus endophyticus]|uniref:Formiminotransferase-cyclodeaminase n=1 Tax=Microlunatus endophyticus TaxID=1716077 RepID=A0A917S3Z7_9ACTN|nr:cyclodeaminase/cyclohydrolase family protein [Microlunatus endophyticus]GGL56284.1 formiminotransferase-cyclodeaminase [Microlunatus endophyticus]
MNTSLWSTHLDDLLRRTASSDPTPGGGSVAAIAGALGVGLIQMAINVTADPSLDDFGSRLQALRERIVPAADGDVEDFSALMAAYRLPRTDDVQRAERKRTIEEATVAATRRPLELVETFAEAVGLSHEVEPLVKKTVVSDVQAGRDLVLGSARAALRTADINIAGLLRLDSDSAAGLQDRRTSVTSRLEIPA